MPPRITPCNREANARILNTPTVTRACILTEDNKVVAQAPVQLSRHKSDGVHAHSSLSVHCQVGEE